MLGEPTQRLSDYWKEQLLKMVVSCCCIQKNVGQKKLQVFSGRALRSVGWKRMEVAIMIQVVNIVRTKYLVTQSVLVVFALVLTISCLLSLELQQSVVVRISGRALLTLY